MGAHIALCVEEEACRNPEIIGLEGENLDCLSWLDVFTTGEESRDSIAKSKNIKELWVLSCDDVDPINLAATVKGDRPDLHVCLVERNVCGSLLSRAHTAGIDEVVEYDKFPSRYEQAKSSSLELVQGTAPSPVAEKTVDATPIELVVEEDNPSPLARFLKQRSEKKLVKVGEQSQAFILTVVSGSGGAGKSATSTLAALIASRWGYKTLLLDCDLQFGDISFLAGEQDALCIDEVISHPERMEAELAKGAALGVLAAPRRLETSEEVVGQLPMLLERLSLLYEVIVVNTGASWAEQHAALLERSAAALFLVDQRVSSVRACRHALELCARCGIAATPFHYALNRCAKGAPLSLMDVSSALQGVPVLELKDGGRDVEDYLSAGAAADLFDTGNEFVRSLERVMEGLLPGGMRLIPESAPIVEDKQRSKRRGRHMTGRRGRRQQ